ncbi:23S rRNA pseudouridine1911/1915/1917 synthase [Constrictibacter sp. MBR-5]|jgi:23S rRNA pseudouridine1911/1915/1917 synthase|uniref:RluA family pseudouridine synthase n=1 Tax=Constrictibacter sp. MBR-5 TaxID=3156467 RepID=UPI0033930D32
MTTAEVTVGSAAERLDRALVEAMPGLSRSRLQVLLRSGSVQGEAGIETDPSRRVRAGERFVVTIPPPEPADPQGQDIPLDVVFEDDDLIVIDKPAGMVVHPAPGSRDETLVNALIARCGESLSGIGGVRRPGIVHRLDKDTSGLLVVAKNDLAHAALSAQFAARTVRRVYRAAVWGLPEPANGRIEGNIGRSTRDRKKMAVLRTGGRPAATRYRVLRSFGRLAAEIECRLETGRTHQIRVHLTSRGHPLIGDPVYGGGGRGGQDPRAVAARAFPRQALHAATLGFAHPRTGEPLDFRSPVPADLAGLLAVLAADDAED